MKTKIDRKSFFSVLKKVRHSANKKQAKQAGYKYIHSISTEKKYLGCARNSLRWLAKHNYSINRISKHSANAFLVEKAKSCCQKTIDGYRQSLSMVFDLDLDYVVSAKQSVLVPRAYRDTQIDCLKLQAEPILALSIEIAAIAGLRAIELDTISRLTDTREDDRAWLRERFFGLDSSQPFIVIGKGGLRRKVMLPPILAEKLEQFRLPAPVIKMQRGINYRKFYSLIGGHNFSQSFSRLSFKLFGWSTGGHGLRHRYAQNRILFLQKSGFTYDFSLKIVSQELGHFSTANTLTYMR